MDGDRIRALGLLLLARACAVAVPVAALATWWLIVRWETFEATRPPNDLFRFRRFDRLCHSAGLAIAIANAGALVALPILVLAVKQHKLERWLLVTLVGVSLLVAHGLAWRYGIRSGPQSG